MDLAEIKKECKNFKELKKTPQLNIGIIPSPNLSTVKTAWKYLPQKRNSPWIGCYAGYLFQRKTKMSRKNLEYFVAYPAMPTWLQEIIDDFNKTFDNIKVEIVNTKDAYLTFEKKTYRKWSPQKGEYNHTGAEVDISQTGGQKKIIIPILKFSYNKDYHNYARYYFPYNISILFRMLSYSESFTDPFHKTRRRNKVEYLADINNKNKGYRTFAERDITLKELKLIDDIEKVNKFSDIVIRNGCSLKQTDFIMGLSGRISDVKNKKLRGILRYPKPKKSSTKRQEINDLFPVVPYCRCVDCRKNRLRRKNWKAGK